MEVLIATCGVLVMGLAAHRWIYRKPSIMPESIGPASAWATAFVGDSDWPWHRRGGRREA